MQVRDAHGLCFHCPRLESKKGSSYHWKYEFLDGVGQGDGKPLEEQGKVYSASDAKEGGRLGCACHD
jgi:hypothetical protein